MVGNSSIDSSDEEMYDSGDKEMYDELSTDEDEDSSSSNEEQQPAMLPQQLNPNFLPQQSQHFPRPQQLNSNFLPQHSQHFARPHGQFVQPTFVPQYNQQAGLQAGEDFSNEIGNIPGKRFVLFLFSLSNIHLQI